MIKELYRSLACLKVIKFATLEKALTFLLALAHTALTWLSKLSLESISMPNNLTVSEEGTI